MNAYIRMFELIVLGALLLVVLLVWVPSPSSCFWEAVTACAIIGTAILGLFQLRQFRNARRIERTIEELTAVQSERFANLERQIFRIYMNNVTCPEKGIPPKPLESWKGYLSSLALYEHDMMRSIARRYERIGLLARRGLLNERLLLEAIHAPIFRLWVALKPWMDDQLERKQAGKGYYFSGFRKLAKSSLSFHKSDSRCRGTPIVLYHPYEDTYCEIYPIALPDEEALFTFQD